MVACLSARVNALSGRGEQRRAAARQQHQEVVLGLEPASDLERSVGRADALLVGIGMTGLDQLHLGAADQPGPLHGRDA